MKNTYEIDFTDYSTGATSAIDIIKVDGDYTAEQYISDCKDNADEEWNAMLENGNVTVIKI